MDGNMEQIFELILLRNIQEKFKLNFPLAEKQKMMVQCKFKKLSVDEKKILESFIESKNKDILEYIKFNLEFKPKLTIDPELNDSQKNTLQHFYNQKISNNIQITKLELSDLSVKMKIDKKIIKKYLLSIFNNGNKKLITIKTSSTIEKSAAGVSAAAQPRQPRQLLCATTELGTRLLFEDKKAGGVVEVVLVAVDREVLSAEQEAERGYTVRLLDGSERNTLRARLRLPDAEQQQRQQSYTSTKKKSTENIKPLETEDNIPEQNTNTDIKTLDDMTENEKNRFINIYYENEYYMSSLGLKSKFKFNLYNLSEIYDPQTSLFVEKIKLSIKPITDEDKIEWDIFLTNHSDENNQIDFDELSELYVKKNMDIIQYYQPDSTYVYLANKFVINSNNNQLEYIINIEKAT